jgi:polar amino acid transport system substrate-binding protein
MDFIMKKALKVCICVVFSVFLTCCEKKTDETLIFAISAEYPPFEYKVNGVLVGFDVELAKMIAKEMGKKIEFRDMQFSAVLASLQNNMVDAAISTITITDKRQENFDFSIPYYLENMALIFHKREYVDSVDKMKNKKIACQLGTTMEIWLKTYMVDTQIITFDNNPQAIEALKAGHVDAVLIDAVQAASFSKKNIDLNYKVVAQANTGYGIAFKKGSSLKADVDKALHSLEQSGAIEQLKKKYLEIK